MVNDSLAQVEDTALRLIAPIIWTTTKIHIYSTLEIKDQHVVELIIPTDHISARNFAIVLGEIHKFTFLTKLSLSDCQGCDISPLLSHLPHLTDLHLTHGQLSDVTPLLACHNLDRLILQDMHLATLPDGLFTLPIRDLDISDNPTLQVLPDTIGRAPRLMSLFAYNCGLRSLPASIGECTSLDELNLGGCPISELPDTMDRIKISHLKLDSPYLTVFPLGFGFKDRTHNVFLKGIPFRSLYGFNKEVIQIGYYSSAALHPNARHLSIPDTLAYYATHPRELAIKMARDPNSLTETELERLAWEGGSKERRILEASPLVSAHHPVLRDITARLQVTLIPEVLGDTILNTRTRSLCGITHAQLMSFLRQHPEALAQSALHPRAKTWIKVGNYSKLEEYYERSAESLILSLTFDDPLFPGPLFPDDGLERIAWESQESELKLLVHLTRPSGHPMIQTIRTRLEEDKKNLEKPNHPILL